MLPQTFKELLNELETGKSYDLICKKKIEDLEGYAEGEMKLTIVGGNYAHLALASDGVVVLNVTYTKFEDHNSKYESKNYYDKNGDPSLTARQAGFYNINDKLYVMQEDNPNDYFNLIPDVNEFKDIIAAESHSLVQPVDKVKEDNYQLFLNELVTKLSKDEQSKLKEIIYWIVKQHDY